MAMDAPVAAGKSLYLICLLAADAVTLRPEACVSVNAALQLGRVQALSGPGSVLRPAGGRG